VVGVIAGLVARGILTEPEPGRFVVTMLLGIAGASLGGLVFAVLGGTGTTGFDVRSLPVAVLGAAILLCLYGLIARTSA
jgi:uncharacterized membrane protein YeaQ/YmgE (transglycosylase-associated protein family)